MSVLNALAIRFLFLLEITDVIIMPGDSNQKKMRNVAVEPWMMNLITEKKIKIWHPTRVIFQKLPDQSRFNNIVVTGMCRNFKFTQIHTIRAERFQTQIETRFENCGTAMIFSTANINMPGLLHMINAALMAELVTQHHMSQGELRFNIFGLKSVLTVVRTRLYFKPDFHVFQSFYPSTVTYEPKKISFLFYRDQLHTKNILTQYGTANFYCVGVDDFWMKREDFLNLLFKFQKAHPLFCIPYYAHIRKKGGVPPRGGARPNMRAITKPITKMPSKRKNEEKLIGRKRRKQTQRKN